MIYCRHCKIDRDYHTCNNGPHIQALCIECGNHLKFISKKQNADGVTVHDLHMGAIQSNSAIYLTISDGKICRRVQSPTDSSKERTTKEGKTVHEEFYKGWTGIITNVKSVDTDYGKKWNVYIQDENGSAILQFNYSSGYAASFLKALPNIDINRAVAIKPNVTMIGDKKKTTIFLEQDGKAVKWFYTKDNPNGLPPMRLVKIKGVESWDDSEMLEFLENETTRLFNSTPF